MKHISAARFQRNHRLINEIFGDTVVPDVRSVVTNARMQVLKRQVQSLTMHQKKLEAELQQIEDKFLAKKRKFIEASEAFKEEIKKKCNAKPVDSATFEKMVEKALEQLKKQQAAEPQQTTTAQPETNQINSQIQPEPVQSDQTQLNKSEFIETNQQTSQLSSEDSQSSDNINTDQQQQVVPMETNFNEQPTVPIEDKIITPEFSSTQDEPADNLPINELPKEEPQNQLLTQPENLEPITKDEEIKGTENNLEENKDSI